MNNVYYYLDSTKTHPDGGWFTCRNGKAGFFSSKEPKSCRSKAGLPKKRQKPGDEFYGNGILYNAFKDTFSQKEFQDREYLFLRQGSENPCGGANEINNATKNPIIYLVPGKQVDEVIEKNNFFYIGNDKELVGLIRRFSTNFLFKKLCPRSGPKNS